MGITPVYRVRKEDPDIRTAYEWMLHQFDEGRQTGVEWEEIASFLVTQR